jgi:hypothetical protein
MPIRRLGTCDRIASDDRQACVALNVGRREACSWSDSPAISGGGEARYAASRARRQVELGFRSEWELCAHIRFKFLRIRGTSLRAS